MAELLGTDREGKRGRGDRYNPRHDTYRGEVQALQCASRARLPGRTSAYRAAVLHELRSHEVCKGITQSGTTLVAQGREAKHCRLVITEPSYDRRCRQPRSHAL